MISLLYGLKGADVAAGPTAVIDTFRAFTTAAFLLDAGVASLLLASEVDEARQIAAAVGDAILCGEDRGLTPPGFDLGNSPGEVLRHVDLAGRVVVQRTSAGTRCLRAAVRAGASPVFGASLVVASATARVLAPGPATIVASGRYGTTRVTEDDMTAEFIAARVRGDTPDADIGRILRSDSAQRLRTAAWADSHDLELCLDVDRFDFAMRAEADADVVRLQRVPLMPRKP